MRPIKGKGDLVVYKHYCHVEFFCFVSFLILHTISHYDNHKILILLNISRTFYKREENISCHLPICILANFFLHRASTTNCTCHCTQPIPKMKISPHLNHSLRLCSLRVRSSPKDL